MRPSPLNNQPPNMLNPNDPGYLGMNNNYGLGSKRNNVRFMAAMMRENRDRVDAATMMKINLLKVMALHRPATKVRRR